MAVQPLVIAPDPRLKKICAPVDAVDEDTQRLARDMLDTMYKAPGIGLAACQIGVLRQVLVMDCAGKDQPPEPMVMVNPKITWTSTEVATYEEGCLSIPDIYHDVERPERVTVAYTDLEGTEQTVEYGGLWATCVQHEIDHLNGKLFIDHLSTLRRNMILRKMRKLKSERAKDEVE
jgi:peptide deformylase